MRECIDNSTFVFNLQVAWIFLAAIEIAPNYSKTAVLTGTTESITGDIENITVGGSSQFSGILQATDRSTGISKLSNKLSSQISTAVTGKSILFATVCFREKLRISGLKFVAHIPQSFGLSRSNPNDPDGVGAQQIHGFSGELKGSIA